ncbi:MAG: Rpn family recombination-promoting nuclease/putative transposase [Magnetococcales bacterium]|nr:Rpn family recombination-promoting nuclease/putative transposase [Magnetococcales bacterium]
MRFLNPKTDFAFKKIFGSEESRDVLISFLNALLALEPPDQITEVTILDPYLAPKIKGMKDSFLDVRVKDQKSHAYIIEMQVLNVAGFEKRVLYNACKTYAGQIQTGEHYRLLTNVVAITITDFTMFEELPDIINRFMLRAGANPEISLDDLELLFAELPKFTKNQDHLVSIVDKWFYFLKHAGGLQTVPKTLADEPAIQKAFAIANKAALSPEELEDQEKREIFIQDQRGAIIFAEQQGEKRGIQIGERIGEQRGIEIGEQRGIEIGEQRGIEIGKARGRRDVEAAVLLRLLHRRFGLVPDEMIEKIHSADLNMIEKWSENFVFADSLEDVFV